MNNEFENALRELDSLFARHEAQQKLITALFLSSVAAAYFLTQWIWG